MTPAKRAASDGGRSTFRPTRPQDRALVAELVQHADADSLAPFCTRADRSYVFSADGRAVVGYRVVFGVAVVGGDPVGASDAAPAAITAFVGNCHRRGWRPAVLGASERTLAAWRAAGLAAGVVVGDEAVIDVARFSMATRRMRNLRQAVQRTRNAGVRVTVGPLDAEIADSLRPVLDDWLDGHRERGFAMNLDRILLPRPDCLYAAAYDRRDRPQAFARFATAASGRILTLDVAPRRSGAPNGVVERLIVEVNAYGRERGVREISLNFAGLRRMLTSTSVPARVGSRLLRAFGPWIQIAPLYQFVAKFQPYWRPRWLLLRSWRELYRVLPAVLVAEFATARRAAPDGDAGPARARQRQGSELDARTRHTQQPPPREDPCAQLP